MKSTAYNQTIHHIASVKSIANNSYFCFSIFLNVKICITSRTNNHFSTIKTYDKLFGLFFKAVFIIMIYMYLVISVSIK